MKNLSILSMLFCMLLASSIMVSCHEDSDELNDEVNQSFMLEKNPVYFASSGGVDSIKITNPALIKDKNRKIYFTEFVALDNEDNLLNLCTVKSDSIDRAGISVRFRPESFDLRIEAAPSNGQNTTYRIIVCSGSFQDQIVIKQ